jgi:hypothetical protein
LAKFGIRFAGDGVMEVDGRRCRHFIVFHRLMKCALSADKLNMETLHLGFAGALVRANSLTRQINENDEVSDVLLFPNPNFVDE